MKSNWEKSFRDKLQIKTSKKFDSNIISFIKEKNTKETYNFWIPSLAAACMVFALINIEPVYEDNFSDDELTTFLVNEDFSENSEILSELDIDNLTDEEWNVLLGGDNEAS